MLILFSLIAFKSDSFAGGGGGRLTIYLPSIIFCQHYYNIMIFNLYLTNYKLKY